MITDNYNIGDLSSKQLQNIAKIAREAKSRTGISVSLRDKSFFSKMAGILQQAGETELVQDLLDINREVSVREDQLNNPKLAASKTVKSSQSFLANMLGSNKNTQEKTAKPVTVKKYDRYKIKVKLFDQFPN